MTLSRARTLTVILAGTIIMFLLPLAWADHPSQNPGKAQGPPTEAYYGLCTAYFAGSSTGEANKRQQHPFLDLAVAAEDDVEAFCQDMQPGNGTNNNNAPPPSPRGNS